GVSSMWQPQGDKLNNPDRLGKLQPVTVLCDVPQLFTCLDSDEELLLAYQCGEEAGVRRLIVLPFESALLDQIKSDSLGVREALKQSGTWVADVDTTGKVTAAWKTDLSKIPDNALPKAGTKLSAMAIPMAAPVIAPGASVPVAAPVAQAARPAAAAPAQAR